MTPVVICDLLAGGFDIGRGISFGEYCAGKPGNPVETILDRKRVTRGSLDVGSRGMSAVERGEPPSLITAVQDAGAGARALWGGLLAFSFAFAGNVGRSCTLPGAKRRVAEMPSS